MIPARHTDAILTLSELLPLIRQNDSAAAEQLCRILTRGITFLIRKRVNTQDVEDQVHEVLLEVLVAIKQDRVRCPEAVAAFARGVAVRKSAAYIEDLVRKRAQTAGSADDLDLSASCSDSFPERTYLNKEQVDIARRAFSYLNPREQEVLKRFYVDEELPQHICLQMKLTPTQFRLLKSRAKSRFGEVGKSLLNTRRPLKTAVPCEPFRDRCA
jgi:RNA polymerase sigma-70 factor (ECF subfamily)